MLSRSCCVSTSGLLLKFLIHHFRCFILHLTPHDSLAIIGLINELWASETYFA